MDHRLALLLQVFKGLRLSAQDLESLRTLSAKTSAQDVIREIQSPAAQTHMKNHKTWIQEAESILQLSERHAIRWTYPGLPDYPILWRELSILPPLVSYRGDPLWTKWPLLSVVGSRTPRSETCLWLQRELSQVLREQKIAIVSGGARGVDQWAHRLALSSGRPTVCVLPSGLLNPYPAEKEDLWQAILENQGALVSTFALHEPMRKSHFHIRNRWIAGLAHLVFVVEANRRSGSMLTAKMARDEGKDVCTLPVDAFAPSGLGNLDLLREGASLVCDSQDLKALIEQVIFTKPLAPRSSQSV